MGHVARYKCSVINSSPQTPRKVTLEGHPVAPELVNSHAVHVELEFACLSG